MEKQYIGKDKVKGFSETSEATPIGSPIIKVVYNDNRSEVMPHKRFELLVTHKESDDSKMRDRLVGELASQIYSFLHEYDLKVEEVDPVLDGVAQKVNEGAKRATEVLFQVDHLEQRTLIGIQKVLMEKYGTEKNNNGTSPERSETGPVDQRPV